MNRLLKIDEAAAVLGLGRVKVYQLIAGGHIETVRIGRARRIPSDALDQFIDNLRAEGPPDSGAQVRGHPTPGGRVDV
jgi:excisionase family DNA binding protein